MRPIRLLPLPLLAAWLLSPHAARAAESYDSCSGFIDSVPATVSSQGVWCLRSHLSTAITTGAAITVTANNVSIDCNGFRLGGLAAGSGSATYGIRAVDRQNLTVRNCNIRGFHSGTRIDGGAGHVIEDNRFDNNLAIGIHARGDSGIVRRNWVQDTGGSGTAAPYGIIATADIRDNTVSGVFGTGSNAFVFGIHGAGEGIEVRGNRVRGLAPTDAAVANGIYVLSDASRVVDNQVSAQIPVNGYGIRGNGSLIACTQNTVTHFQTPYLQCSASVGNITLPAP